MKITSVKYLAGEGVKNVWVNRLMSLASIGVLVACMTLIGLAILLSLNVDKSLGMLEQQNVIMVYFNDQNSVLYGSEKTDTSSSNSAASDTATQSTTDGTGQDTQQPAAETDNLGLPIDSYTVHNEEEALAVCEALRQIDNVLSVEYISAEQGLESVKESMLEGQAEYFEFLDEEYGNPLSAGAKVVFKDLGLFEQTIEKISQTEGVDTIVSQSELAKKITSIRDGISIAGVWIIAILLVIALVIVSNTIRITIYNRKLEISIMKAVGATDSFVRLPFIVEGITIGIISSLLSEGFVYFAYRIILDTIRNTLGMDSVVAFSSVAFALLGIFLVIGILAGSIGSAIIVGKYLKREGSEFRAFA